MTNIDLLPCVCGGDAVIHGINTNPLDRYAEPSDMFYYRVECSGCGTATAWHETEEAAIADWQAGKLIANPHDTLPRKQRTIKNYCYVPGCLHKIEMMLFCRRHYVTLYQWHMAHGNATAEQIQEWELFEPPLDEEELKLVIETADKIEGG